jgi:hypothetical protein
MLRCNKNQIHGLNWGLGNQIHGLNWGLANKVNFIKIQYMVIHLFCKIPSYGKKDTFQNDFSIGCGTQVAYQAT